MPRGGGRAREVTGGHEPTGLLQDPRGGSRPLGCGSRRATKGEGSSEENPAHSILFLRGIWLASQTLGSLAFSPGLCDICLCGSTWSLNPGMPGAGCAPPHPGAGLGPFCRFSATFSFLSVVCSWPSVRLRGLLGAEEPLKSQGPHCAPPPPSRRLPSFHPSFCLHFLERTPSQPCASTQCSGAFSEADVAGGEGA